MQNVFITKIHIDKVRHLTDVEIVLSDTERKHLILTGKNGSGKTSLLEAIRNFILLKQRSDVAKESLDTFQKIAKQQNSIFSLIGSPETTGVEVDFSREVQNFFHVPFAYLAAERSDFVQPKAVEAIEILGKTIITRNASRDFLKYILSMYVQYLSAKDSGGPADEIARYTAWFERFTQALRDIYHCQELELKPDMKKLEFLVVLPGREPFGLHQMSDGYKAFLEIYMELLMRFESDGGTVDYDLPAIVLIDELETHLHVELQKRALPFLTQMFPAVQFIVSTHSPFVITSLANAVVYDLEKRERLEDPSFFSYETVVESFLDTDMYSEELKRQFKRYEELCFKERTAEENDEFLEIKTKLELLAPASKELHIKFRYLEQKRKAAEHDKNHEA